MQDDMELWRRWRLYADRQARDQLIESYLWLVRVIAGRLLIGLPPQFEREELESYGAFGLIEAVERFDPDRGVRFETFASKWIAGQIFEGIKAMQWAPALRRRVRQLEKAIAEFSARFGREPTLTELAEAMGLSVAETEERMREIGTLTVLSMDQCWLGETGDGSTLGERLADPDAPDPTDAVFQQEQHQRLMEALAILNEKERLVIALFYYEGLTVKEIAAVMGVTPARVSQIHSRAIARLRGKLSRNKAALCEV